MQKLDPRSKWLFFIRYIGVTLLFGAFFSSMIASVVGAIGGLGFGLGAGLVIFVLVIAGAYLAAHLSYVCYSYELDEHVFKKEFGVIMRRSTNIPYERIQNVDIVRGLLSRILGLADLNIQTAGGSAYGLNSEGRLPGVSKEQALIIQADILARARGRQQVFNPAVQYQPQALNPVQAPAAYPVQPPVLPTAQPVAEYPAQAPGTSLVQPPVTNQPPVYNNPQDTSGL